MTKSNAALITGASSGIGRCFARELAYQADKYNVQEIWIVARREERLKTLKSEIEESTSVRVHYLVADLADTKSYPQIVQEFADTQQGETRELTYLINAAGWGDLRSVQSSSVEQLTNMVHVNCGAVVALTRAFLPYMQKGSHIIMMASGLALLPYPGAAVYSATKSFVLSFSQALRHELKEKSVTCTAVCPKAVATEFFDHSQGVQDVALQFQRFGLEKPIDVVRRALRDSSKNSPLSISSVNVRALQLAVRFLPLSCIWRVMMVKKDKAKKAE